MNIFVAQGYNLIDWCGNYPTQTGLPYCTLIPRLSPQKRWWGGREPGNICGKSCQLPLPCSGGTNQIAARNHMYTRQFVHSAKNCQLENWIYKLHYTSKIGEKQFSDVRKRLKLRESKFKVCCSWFAGLIRSPYFVALSLHLQSVSRKSTQLWMPRRWGAKLLIACATNRYSTNIVWQLLLKWEHPTWSTWMMMRRKSTALLANIARLSSPPVFEERPLERGSPYCIVTLALLITSLQTYLAHFQFIEAQATSNA